MPEPPASRRPNLLILMMDQMQAEFLDDHAPVALPGLRQLSRVSTRFTSAFTPAPICTPARACFQLGLPVCKHGVIGNDRPMPGLRTLADRLAEAGYATSYAGKWHLDPNDSRGWENWTIQPGPVPSDRGYAVMAGPDAPHEGIAPYGDCEHIDGRVAEHGLGELSRLKSGGRPFALMVSFYGPHAPYYVPRKWHDFFDPDALPLPETFDAPFAGKPAIQERFRCRAWGSRWTEEKWRRVRAAYFGYMAMLDSFVARLIGNTNLSDTAVLLVSDHGENNGHLRMIYKGPMMYDTLVRIPALLHLPGQAGAADDDRLADLTDFTATLLRLSGASEEGIEGHDLADAGWPGRDAVVSEFHEANWVQPVCNQRVAMLRNRRWKYVYNEGDRDELYDLADRPMEVINRVDEAALRPVVDEMHKELARRLPWV